MKKKLLITLVGIILLVPCYIKANNMAPETLGYKGVVTNKDGLYCEKSDIQVPYGSIIDILEEYYTDGSPRLGYTYNGMDCFTEINYSDFRLYTKDFNIMDYYGKKDSGIYKKSPALDILVVGEEGTKLYNGPSFAYDVLKTVPKNTELMAEYSIYEKNFATWVYVNYDGKSGWINLTTFDVVYGHTKKDAIVMSGNGKDIKENTIIDEYYWCNVGTMSNYIKYKNEMRFVYLIAPSSNETVELKEDINLIDTIIEDNVIDKIPKGTKLKAMYTYYDETSTYFYYVSYNGKKGWILVPDYYEGEIEHEESISDKYRKNIEIKKIDFLTKETNQGSRLYLNFEFENKNEINVGKIKFVFIDSNNKTITKYLNDYESKPYIDIDSTLPVGKYDLKYINFEMNDKEKITAPFNMTYYGKNIVIKKIKSEEETKKQIEEIHKINNKHLYIGIASAISITITSIILIILINKRRKNKSKN